MSEPLLPLWTPTPAQCQATNLHALKAQVKQETGQAFADYAALHQWSVDEPVAFWSQLWDFAGIIGDPGDTVLVNGEDIERARFFPNAKLNYAENLLGERAVHSPDADAIIFQAEDKCQYTLTYDELQAQVAAVASWLKQQGVVKGDRIAGYVPNTPETVIAMLAATSLGAVWTSTSPDFGAESVIERFGQTQPTILFAADGYFYNGKSIAMADKVTAVREAIASIEQVVIMPLLARGGVKAAHPADSVPWATVLTTEAAPLTFAACDFNDPLFILYSSGTTGKPKCIVHSVGGTLLQHRKEHLLHADIRAGDRFFYFTTCGWMMWNWLVTGLASGAALVLYEGSPFKPSPQVLWDLVDRVGVTHFGTSAKYIDALKKHQIHPRETHDLSTLRTISSTGSVLAPESFEFVYQHIKTDVCLASIAGGTDIVSCFVLGCPILPVYAGQCQCPGLGMDVRVFDADGVPLPPGEKGELVCAKPFPSRPVGFWQDDSGEKYHAAYFADFPGVWCHGDYIARTPQDGYIIYGRSDATLNPGGVRIGTAEIYRYVEQLPEVIESIVVGQDWDNDVRVVLFVVLAEGVELTNELQQTIRDTVRSNCTPRHVPAKIIAIPAIPRTKSGKIVELAVREVIHGRPVKNEHALANPEALAHYRELAALQN